MFQKHDKGVENIGQLITSNLKPNLPTYKKSNFGKGHVLK